MTPPTGSPQTGVLLIFWFMFWVFALGFGCLVYLESKNQEEAGKAPLTEPPPTNSKRDAVQNGLQWQ
jgi:hypothetical protein